MKNCPSLNKGFPYICNICGVVGHKATQCPNKVSEVADEQAKAANEPEQENSADLISWGG